MTDPTPAASTGIAMIGCGDVARAYAERIPSHPRLTLVGAFDRNPPRAAQFTSAHGGRPYSSLDELLSDPSVEVVLNLTRQSQHFELTKLILNSARHVYSEKPLALSFVEAQELVELADANGVRLACAPTTHLGDAQLEAWRLVQSGALGRVRVVYADANWGRIESWHPRPQDFYDVGPTFDVGVYPLTMITSILGPVASVQGSGKTLLAERTTASGEPFTPGAPDFTTSSLSLRDGTLVRLTANFYVPLHSKQQGLEFHGDDGSLHISSPHWFNADLSLLTPSTGEYTQRELGSPPLEGADYARGVALFASAIRDGTPHHGSGAQAAHVVEVIEAIHRSARTGEIVEISSSFEGLDVPRL